MDPTTKPKPFGSEVSCQVPQQVTSLGLALASVSERARKEMTRKTKTSGRSFDFVADLVLHLGVIEQALTHLSPRFDDMMETVIQNDKASAIDAGRAAGRFEQVLFEFICGYQEARRSRPEPATEETRELLMRVYEHHISEILEWVERLVAAIANPLASLKSQHLHLNAEVTLPIHMNLTSPPEMGRLTEIIQEHQDRLRKLESIRDLPQRPGALATIGAVAFGLGVVNTLWGHDHQPTPPEKHTRFF